MKPFAIALGLALALPLAAAAQTRDVTRDGQGREAADRDPVIITASCADLRAEVAAARAECQPAREVAAPRARVVAVSEVVPDRPRRVIRALPWLIGAYN
jgi:hypothetical protein